jgi:hypothetical protein
MCRGETDRELTDDFERRAREREFPTCPPFSEDRQAKDDKVGYLTFVERGVQYFHHGGQFALTRWTNLYFPASQLLWGDAIGGPVGPIFGDGRKPTSTSNITDIKVSTNSKGIDRFFAHVLYWDGTVPPETNKAPHIAALRDAIDIADEGLPNALPGGLGRVVDDAISLRA